MTRRQKGKSKKRRASWHTAGPGPDRRFERAALAFAGLEPTGANVTAAAPIAVLHGKSRPNRGEASS